MNEPIFENPFLDTKEVEIEVELRDAIGGQDIHFYETDIDYNDFIDLVRGQTISPDVFDAAVVTCVGGLLRSRIFYEELVKVGYPMLPVKLNGNGGFSTFDFINQFMQVPRISEEGFILDNNGKEIRNLYVMASEDTVKGLVVKQIYDLFKASKIKEGELKLNIYIIYGE